MNDTKAVALVAAAALVDDPHAVRDRQATREEENAEALRGVRHDHNRLLLDRKVLEVVRGIRDSIHVQLHAVRPRVSLRRHPR